MLRTGPPVPDRHVRRSGDDYAHELAALLPKGQAWPREPFSTLMLTVSGLAQYYGVVDGRAADLLERESDPRATIELLEDWERAWGLPDPCFSPMPLTIADRHKILLLKMTLLGTPSRKFYTDWAKFLGYNIYITEYSPFMCGVSMCGDTSDLEVAAGGDPFHMRWYVMLPENRFMWTVHVENARLTWFRCGVGQCGIDHLLTIGLAQDLECMIRRWAHAYTVPIFDYSSLATGGAMAGTP